jgi:hypothetical protein
MTPEEKKARKAEQGRQYREANKEKIAEQGRQRYEANKAKIAEKRRRWDEANKAKIAEHRRQYREANKAEIAEHRRQYREANKAKIAEKRRRLNRTKLFAKEDGSSFEAWIASLNIPTTTFAAIANLTPDEGQTLAELIHELSGYAMDVCEQIANPPIEAEPEALTPEPTADLF